MLLFLCRRLLLLIPTLAGISALVFLMIHLVPGDPAQIMLGERANAVTLAALRAEMRLDQPLHHQFGHFLSGLVTGDLGRSLRTQEKVTTELLQRFPATFELTVVSMIIAVALGSCAGLVAAARQGRWLDHLCMVGATTGISLPVFWLGLMLILVFAVQLPLLPVSGRISTHLYVPPVTHFYLIDAALALDGSAIVDVLRHLTLPALTLCTIPMAVIARMTRASLLETLGQDFIRTAWAKGLSERAVLLRHAFRNAAIPTLTVIALEFGFLLGGAIITETIFSWPGVGRWVFLAVQARDFRVVQGGVLLLATLFVLVNTCADLLYAWLDPRIRYDRR